MSQSIKTPDRIKSLIKETFLDKPIDEYDRQELAQLSPNAISGIGNFYASKLKNKTKISTIAELAKMDIARAADIDISPKLLEKWVLVANIIFRYSKSTEIPVNTRRVCVAGLESAGKSSLIKTLQFQQTFAVNMPTQGAAVENLTFLGLSLAIWDLGGQQSFRELYLGSPDNYFTRTMLLAYVIDVQKEDRALEVADYLDKLLAKFKYLKENPKIYIVLHKYDPNVDKRYLEASRQFIISKIRPVLAKYNSESKFFLTTIFDIPNLIKSFSRIFADVSPVTEILSASLNHYAEMHQIHAAFLLTDNGFIAAEWTARLSQERRDDLFMEILEILREDIQPKKDQAFERTTALSKLGGIHITIERIQIERMFLYLSTISTGPSAVDDQNMQRLHEELKPWIVNFFSIINE